MKFRHFICLVTFACVFSLLTGCQNTISGVGKDMQNAGHSIQKSADEK